MVQPLLAANKSGGLVVNDIAQLAGMSEQEIALAAVAAREKGLDNKWLIPAAEYHPTTRCRRNARLCDAW
ncbi:hypothetical protein ACNKHT_09845 [Shigella flexneri]